MPGSRREVGHAQEEGVEFVWLAEPEAFHGNNGVEAIQFHKMHLGIPDLTGRQKPEPIPGSSVKVRTNMVIKALGFEPEDIPSLFHDTDLVTTEWGTVKVDESSKMTTIPGVFAAGDIMRGASLVVWAIRDGRDAASGIVKYLQSSNT